MPLTKKKKIRPIVVGCRHFWVFVELWRWGEGGALNSAFKSPSLPTKGKRQIIRHLFSPQRTLTQAQKRREERKRNYTFFWRFSFLLQNIILFHCSLSVPFRFRGGPPLRLWTRKKDRGKERQKKLDPSIDSISDVFLFLSFLVSIVFVMAKVDLRPRWNSASFTFHIFIPFFFPWTRNVILDPSPFFFPGKKVINRRTFFLAIFIFEFFLLRYVKGQRTEKNLISFSASLPSSFRLFLSSPVKTKSSLRNFLSPFSPWSPTSHHHRGEGGGKSVEKCEKGGKKKEEKS